MSIVSSLDAAEGVAERAFSMLARDAGPRHQRSRCSPQIMQSPAADAGGPVERGLEFRDSADRHGEAAAGKHIRVVAVAGLRSDDGERRLGQFDGAGGALLARFLRNRPHAIVRDVGPAHADDFGAPLRRQEKQAHHAAERAGVLGRQPYPPQLVIGQNAGALVRVHAAPDHAADDRRPAVVVSARVPVHDAAGDGEAIISLPGAVLVFDAIEQSGDVGPADSGKFPIAPSRQEVTVDQAQNFVRRAQLVLLDMPPLPVGDHSAEALCQRLDRRLAGLNALDDQPRPFTRLADRQDFGRADGDPPLFAVGSAGHGGELLCPVGVTRT